MPRLIAFVLFKINVVSNSNVKKDGIEMFNLKKRSL